MNTSKLRRVSVLAGLAGVAVATAFAFAAPAQAGTGTEPGNVSFNPASGGPNDLPVFTTTDACPAPFNDGAALAVLADDGTIISAVSDANPDVKTPFSQPVNLSMGLQQQFLSLLPGHAYEYSVQCQDPNFEYKFVQSMWVTFDASGNWTSSPTPPTSTAVATTTSMTATPTTAAAGDPVALDATVTAASGDPAGNVQFFDGGTAVGNPVAVASGAASTSVSTLSCGTHSLTAKFQPTDPNAFTASTSSAVSVTINGAACALQGSETINVDIPSTGAFTFSVDGTPVSLGTAAANGNNLEATGHLAPVTVQDTRNTVPGWSVSGQASDFSDGTHTIDGNSLGWTPAITTPNAANDVNAGSAINPGTNPGLKQGGTLANAAASHGSGQTTLGGGLDLVVPASTNAGSYHATLTITAIDTAS